MENGIIGMLQDEFGLTEIAEDTPLFSSKLLDSMDVLRLIIMLEDTFSIKIPTFEVSLDMFDTPDSIAALVMSRKK